MFGVWVCLAFINAACWGLTVVVNKRTLRFVDPIALNAILRVPTLVIMAVFIVPLTLLHGWSLGFGMTWAAAGYIALAATVTWLIAFNTYYLALRLGTVGVVTPIMATDPVFTALFVVLLLGATLGRLVMGGSSSPPPASCSCPVKSSRSQRSDRTRRCPPWYRVVGRRLALTGSRAYSAPG